MENITFASHGTTCAAWHLKARSGVLAGPDGRPCLVMAHGFGGTRDTGLLAYADGFADAGLDVLVFDYRGFGDSDGMPRQDVFTRRQRQDYHAAIATARRLAGVDPARIVLWGTSYSGGHVVAVAAQDRRVAAVVSMTPVTDGLVSLTHLARRVGVSQLARLTGHGVRDLARVPAGRPPHHVPLVGPPGSPALISTAGAEEAYTAIAGPTWRNEVCARTALRVGFNRPVTRVRRVACPLLVQVATGDSLAPPAAARRTARKAGSRACLFEYPVGHFDVYTGPWQQRALADQIDFVTRAVADHDVPATPASSSRH